MTSTLSIIDDQTTLKQNYVNSDSNEDAQNLVFKEKQKMWMKLYRVSQDGTEKAILIPFDTYIEPFYTIDDIDTVNTTGVFDGNNDYYRLYSDANGNYKTIQSEYICWQNNRTIKTIQMTVYAEDTSGDVSTGFEAFVYNGQDWIATGNGYTISMIDYTGADLDADLDADLGAQLSNKDSDGNILFQNKLKWKINRVGDDEVRITKIVIKVTWNEGWTSDIYGVDKFPTPFGTWGSL